MILSTLKTVACRGLPSLERRQDALDALDGLGATESFLLESDAPPAPILDLLHKERPGRFDWAPLEEGPESWRTLVTRRAAAGPEREVGEALAWDHDRLEDLEKEAFACRAAGRLEEAELTFSLFAHGLRRHIGIEEGILFPELELRSGIPPHEGPTASMRAEHREIARLIAEIAPRIGAPGAAVEPLRTRLLAVLQEHHVKEETVLFPVTDRLLSPDERDRLVRRIQAFPG